MNDIRKLWLVNLPTEVVHNIVSHLSQKDIQNSSQVCKAWRSLFSSILCNETPRFMSNSMPMNCNFYHGELDLSELIDILRTGKRNSVILFSMQSKQLYDSKELENYPASLAESHLQFSKLLHKDENYTVILFSKIDIG